jgi:GNAT superfamily N-acetyltransferase
MVRAADPRHGRGMDYSFLIACEDGIEPDLRAGLATLLAATLDDGERYVRRAWRTLRPSYRVVALGPGGEPIGQASCFWVPCRPASRLLGLGDVAVAPDHRGQGVARISVGLAVHEGWRHHATAMLAKTKPLRGVLSDLGFAAVPDGRFFYLEDGERVSHPDWMAAVRGVLPASLQLDEGDF